MSTVSKPDDRDDVARLGFVDLDAPELVEDEHTVDRALHEHAAAFMRSAPSARAGPGRS